MILVTGLLHAQSSQSGTQASPAPAPTKGAAPVDAKPNETAKAIPAATPLQAASQLFRSGKLAEAEAAYKEVLKGEPQSPDAYVGLVRVNLRQKRREDAEAARATGVELGAKSRA